MFVSLGSWGDLFPILGVAVEMQRRGHGVRVGASPAWETVVLEAGVGFAPLGRWIGFEEFDAHPEILRPVPFGLRAALDRFMFDQADELVADVEHALDGVDIVVVHPAHLVAQNVAERRGVPYAVATVFPGMIPSRFTVPGGAAIGPWRGWLGRAANRASWSSAAVVTSLLFDRPINRQRRQLGLGRVFAGPLRMPLRARGVIVMASPAVIPPPPDWPENVVTTSFVTWDRADERPVPRDVDEFLDSGDPPALITLGGSGAIAAGDFLEQATDAVVGTGTRALVVSGAGPRPASRHAADMVHVAPYAPFSKMAARCSFGVHHAGIGTAVALMRGGVPHVAVPRAFDQPTTAAMIEDLGVGVSVPWRRRKTLGRAIQQVTDDRRFASAARRLARALAGEADGALQTADVLERLVHGQAHPG